jgi:hypothetical protein
VLVPDLIPLAGRLPGKILPDPEDLVFFDLETTGLSGGAGTVAFLAAFGRFTPIRRGQAPGMDRGAEADPPGFRLRIDQYLLLDYSGEHDFLEVLLPEFLRAGGSSLAFTYNGKSFDAQILKTRCLMNGFTPPVYDHADLLHPARRLWRRVLPSCSQGEIETAVLGLDRTADVPGALAPDIWFSFLRSGDGEALLGICDHNVRDIVGLAALFSALGHIARDPLETGKAYRVDMAALALRWREAARGGLFPALPPGRFPGLPELRETAEGLLAAAEGDHPGITYIRGLDLIRGGSPEAGRGRLRSLLGEHIPPPLRAAAYRTLSIDAEWRLRDLKAALDYVEAALGVCRASRLKSQKIADQAIFYPANSESTPDNRDFCGTDGAKIYKCNRLLGLETIGGRLETEFLRRRDRLRLKAARHGGGAAAP